MRDKDVFNYAREAEVEKVGESRCVLNIEQMGLLVDLMCRTRSKKG